MTAFVDNIDNFILKINEFKHEIIVVDNPKFHTEEIYIKTTKIIDNSITDLESWKNKQFSNQLLTSVNSLFETYAPRFITSQYDYFPNLIDKYNNIYNVFLELKKEIKRIDYLSVIKEKNVVLIGGNGTGKSSFASYLKDSLSDNIIVIPAQKFLFFNLQINQLHLMNKESIKSIQQDNLIGRGKFPPNLGYGVGAYINDLSQLFSKFITVLVNEEIQQGYSISENITSLSTLQKEKSETILYRLNSLWKNLIPDIIFEIDTTNRILIPVKAGIKYDLNAMSDGEKAILYYICYVLLAEPNSFIVIDEPETFLNASNFNRLWNTLEAYRSDCKYIYISHVVDFIASRTNADLLWCKQFDYPDTWDIQLISAENPLSKEFPRELLSELLGARKKILFCEGEKSSLDYTIYSNLFKDEVIVYPVGGHNQVIQYTKSYNELSTQFNGNNAIGIIDADLMDNQTIEDYKKENIYTLNFNEIEMLLLTDEVMTDVLQHSFSPDILKQKIVTFKSEFLKTISDSIEKVLFEKIRKYMNTNLSNYRIDTSINSEQISGEVNTWLDKLNVVEESEKFETEIKKFIQEENYEKLLELCPLKGQISKGLANRFLDNQYVDRALNRITCNEILSKDIRKKYFGELLSLTEE